MSAAGKAGKICGRLGEAFLFTWNPKNCYSQDLLGSR